MSLHISIGVRNYSSVVKMLDTLKYKYYNERKINKPHWNKLIIRLIMDAYKKECVDEITPEMIKEAKKKIGLE